MNLEISYINHRIEMLEGVYDSARQAQYLALTRLYNPTQGPITSINLHRPDAFDLSMYSTSCNHTSIGSIMRDLRAKAGMADSIFIPGGGKGVSIRSPFLGGLGEAAERLLAVLHFEVLLDQLVPATYEELVSQGRRALGPDDMSLFAPEQYAEAEFGYRPFKADTPLCWIEGSDLLTGEPVLVPAQLVLIYYKHHPDEAHIAYPTTGGLAFHVDYRAAILHGLYEVIERDAINVRWYCKLPPPRVEINASDFVRHHLEAPHARMFTPNISEIRTFLNTLDISLPIFTAIAVDRSRQQGAFLGGGGAWSTRERALVQALFELGQTRTALKFFRPIGMKSIEANSDVSEMTDFFDAAVYFGYAENLPRLSWYTAGESVIPWEATPTFVYSDSAEEYKSILNWLRTTNLKPILFDFSGACWAGVSVLKVFIPQLTQACIPSHPFLGHSRFYELPRALGLAEGRLSYQDLNVDPVPFP